MNGDEFLKFMHDMRGTKDVSRQKQLLEMLELNPKGKIKKFSKGMKQKLGIVAAFMHDPDVLILDEPTSGLDPLMQNRFVELVLSEKERGKTILLSSHMFEEVEKTCDNVLIIKEGRIVKQSDVQSLKDSRRKGFLLKAKNPDAAAKALQLAGFEPDNSSGDTVEVYVSGQDVDRFIKTASQFSVLNLDVKAQTLEDVFIEYYRREGSKA
jgi:ABC-2 type transport system ATP-binding protein